MKKIIALYLPQYHSIPENDKWWGKGYTEWTAVKNAIPLFDGHKQPKMPLNNNYYDLSKPDGQIWKWQSGLANKYGLYGFAIYHYWFGNRKMLLEKPMEILLEHKEIDIRYSIVWANETWTKAWYDQKTSVLIEQKYGDKKDWEAHFYYLLNFFKDERYIKMDNKPVIHIYKPGNIDCLDEMLSFWRKLAKKNGFPDLFVVAGNTILGVEKRISNIDAFYCFEPGFSQKYKSSSTEKIKRKASIFVKTMKNKILRKNKLERFENIDSVYKAIQRDMHFPLPTFLGTFPQWDNTPRRGYKGSYFNGASPEKFYESLKDVYMRSDKDAFIYINAWNEWGEGCYLEPDTEYKFDYLDVVKKVVDGM